MKSLKNTMKQQFIRTEYLEVFFYSAHLWVILLHCASVMLFSKWKLVSLFTFFHFNRRGVVFDLQEDQRRNKLSFGSQVVVGSGFTTRKFSFCHVQCL